MSVVHVNESNFTEEVLNSDIPVIVDFFANWCGPCNMMAPVFEEVSKKFRGKLKFVKANVDENPIPSSKFRIQSIPALVIIKDGEEVGRFLGSMEAEALIKKIKEIMD